MSALAAACERLIDGLAAPTPLCSRLVRLSVWLAVIGGTGQLIVHLINGLALDSRYYALNPDKEFNIFSWASSSATFGAALALVLMIAARPKRTRRLLLLAMIIAYLSADDALVLHERVSRKVFVQGFGMNADLGARLFAVIFAPLLLLGLVLLLDTARSAARPAALAIVIGLTCLGLAIVAELASGVLSDRGLIVFEQWSDIVEASIEECLELVGWILIAGGLFAEAGRQIATTD